MFCWTRPIVSIGLDYSVFGGNCLKTLNMLPDNNMLLSINNLLNGPSIHSHIQGILCMSSFVLPCFAFSRNGHWEHNIIMISGLKMNLKMKARYIPKCSHPVEHPWTEPNNYLYTKKIHNKHGVSMMVAKGTITTGCFGLTTVTWSQKSPRCQALTTSQQRAVSPHKLSFFAFLCIAIPAQKMLQCMCGIIVHITYSNILIYNSKMHYIALRLLV